MKNNDTLIKAVGDKTEGLERDMLTGLYQFEAVKRVIEQKLEKSDFSKENYLIVINIDGFWAVDKQRGCLFADTVISTFSDEFKIQFSESCAGRIGANEFVAYVEDISLEGLREKQSELNRHIRKVYSEIEDDITISCSIGAVTVKSRESFEELLISAKSALNDNETTGKLTVYQEGKTSRLEHCEKISLQEYSQSSLYGTEGDLILFAVELFEKVPDIKSAIRILSDRICKLYQIQDIVYLMETADNRITVTYHWDKSEREVFAVRNLSAYRAEWNVLLHQHGRNGISVLREKEMQRENKTDGKSLLSICFGEDKEAHYMLFVDREQDRDWQSEMINLRRLAWIMHKRLRQMENERRELERTNYIIEHDDKTDLYNYTKFLSMAERLVRENSQKTYALIYSDFSNFQFLNETYGYVTGDKVLIDFACALKENCVHGVLYSRVTGDHFISLHEYSDDVDLAGQYVKVCDAFCEKVNRKYNLCNLILMSGMSIIDDPKVKMARYVDNANIARKAAKKDTLTRCKVFSEDMRLISQRQMELAARMEKALQNGEFVMHLQPKVDLRNGKISGAEALVRWVKEDGGMIYPDEFIPLFEKNGFIVKIDFEILRQVLVFQRSIMDRGMELFPISVNFSRKHQKNPFYVEEVSRMMQEYQVPSQYIEIEVTESVFMDDFTVLNQNISKLKKTGVMIAIDDFGSGYSSLNVLSKVDADVIKLDRKFLLDMEDDSGGVKKNFLNTLILMIKQLGFKVLAEGVETAGQEELLKNTGCEYAQGYLYAKPMGAADFMEFSKNFGKTVLE